MNCVIVDDHDLVREGMRDQLGHVVPELKMIGSYKNGQEAINCIDWDYLELLITDIEMEPVGGLELIEHCKKVNHDIKIVVISQWDSPPYQEEVKKLGANGYLLKNANLDIIIGTIEGVIKGNISSFICFDKRPYVDLTQREIDIITLISKGLNSKDIAKVIHLSPRSVEGYRRSICEKMDVNNSQELVAKFN